MRKLLIGITLSELGGSQKVVYNIISNLPENEYEITLLTSPGGELINWTNELNRDRILKINIITLKSLKREITFLDDLKAFIDMLIIFRKEKYDIAHFNNSKIGLLGRIAARTAGVPKIFYTVHGWGINVYNSGIKRRILELSERIAGRLSTKIVCVSNYDMEKGVKSRLISPKKAFVIHNGIDDNPANKVDLHTRLDIPDMIPIIAFVARLSEPKAPIFAIEVAYRIKMAGYDFRFLIIGDGPLKNSCTEHIYKLGVDDKVLMLGACYDVREMLHDVDIFALFSKWEGLPISVIEAMFAGKPVIANNVGGLPELVYPGINGYLLDSFNIEQASDYIIRLIADAEHRETMGESGREIANKEYKLDEMVKKYHLLYSEE